MSRGPLRVTKENILPFLKSFDNILTDCDGVLWSGDERIGQSHLTLNKLKELKKKIFYVTNNSTKSRDEFTSKANRLEFDATKEQFVTSSFVLAEYLKQKNLKNKKIYVVGSTGISQELDNANISNFGVGPDPVVFPVFNLIKTTVLDPDVGAVVVGFDAEFSFPKILKAASYLKDQNCLFIGTNTDEQFPSSTNNIIFPGTGCFIRCIETVAERKAEIMGKPSVKMFDVISEKHKLDPSRTLMIGDRSNTDILFGKNCQMSTMVVLSGVTKWKDIEKWQKIADDENNAEAKYCSDLLADYYIPSLGELYDLIKDIE